MEKFEEKVYREWFAELRSGKYLQIREYLKEGETERCCLGVLGDVLTRHDERVVWNIGGLEFDLDRSYTKLPESVTKSLLPAMKKQVLLSVDEDLERCGTLVDKAWRMNDLEGKAFKEIADYMEKELFDGSDGGIQ